MVVLTGCSRAPIVTVTNHSSITLSNVVVSGSGFSDQVGTIAARGDKRITVHPNADTGLRVAFDAGGHHVDSGQQAYFEPAGNYLVSAIVNTDLTVAVSTRLRSPGGPPQHVAEGTPTLSNLTHSEVGGNQFETFELRVPSGRRVSVTRSWLVRDHGVATEMLRPPTWAGNSDPSGKFYGPGSKSLLCIVVLILLGALGLAGRPAADKASGR